MTSLPRRTAAGVRTMSTAPLGHAVTPRCKYARLARLAFEKEHRKRDIQAARRRIEDGEERIAEIEREEARLLASIEAARQDQDAPRGRSSAS